MDNVPTRSFVSVEEAKRTLAPELGKYGEELVTVDGKRIVVVGSDCVYDGIWSRLHKALTGVIAVATPDKDLAVDEASRLRDEFIESLKRVCGVDDIVTAIDEF